jgi:hypothetical protein
VKAQGAAAAAFNQQTAGDPVPVDLAWITERVSVAITGAKDAIPGIDWGWVAEKTPAVITGAKDLVLAGAAVCTTCFAWKALDKWRTEALGKRRLELAEDVLSGFYQVREIIQDARAPLVLAGEMVREEGLSDAVAGSPYYAPMRRLSRSFDKIADLRAKRHRFAAMFGTKATSPWDEIEQVLREIQAASDALLDLRGEHVGHNDPNAQFYIEQRRVLARRTENDPITPRLDAAVAGIERHCIPTLTRRS